MQTISEENIFQNDNTRKKPSNQVPRLLIVEDDKCMKPIWSFVTSAVDNNIQVDWATSELEAERIIYQAIKDEHLYDLVIIDIFLEGSRTGLDLYEVFGDLFHDKMIITSGTEYQHYVEYLSKKSNPPYCLEKPLVPEECVKLVNKMLH